MPASCTATGASLRAALPPSPHPSCQVVSNCENKQEIGPRREICGDETPSKSSAAHTRWALVHLPLVSTNPKIHLSKVREKPPAAIRKVHRLQMERAMTLVSRQAYLRMLSDGSRERSKYVMVSSLRRILNFTIVTKFCCKQRQKCTPTPLDYQSSLPNNFC